MVKKNIILLIIFLLFILFGVFYLRNISNSNSIRIGYLNITASLPLFVLEDSKELKEASININAIPFKTSNQLADAILNEQIDIAIEMSVFPFIVNEINKPNHAKIAFISQITKEKAFDALIIKNNSEIKSLTDLKNKVIGHFPGQTAKLFLQDFLYQKGISIKESQLITAPPNIQQEMIANNQIDVLHAYEPAISQLLATNEYRILHKGVYDELISPNPQGVTLYSTKFIESQPSEFKKVNDLLIEVNKSITNGTTDYITTLQKRFGYSQSVLNELQILELFPSQDEYAESLGNYIQLLKAQNLIDKEIDSNSLLLKNKQFHD